MTIPKVKGIRTGTGSLVRWSEQMSRFAFWLCPLCLGLASPCAHLNRLLPMPNALRYVRVDNSDLTISDCTSRSLRALDSGICQAICWFWNTMYYATYVSNGIKALPCPGRCFEIQLGWRVERGEYSQRLICIRAHSLNGWAALYSHYVHFVQHLQQLYHHPPLPDAFILHTRQDPSISENDLVLDKYRQVGSESGFFGGGGVANLCDRRTGIGV